MLELRGVTKRYTGIPVVSDVSFIAAAGEVTGYLGPNGSGKSTTLKMITGLIEPSEGEILAHLGLAYANRGYTSQYSDQTLTWERDIRSLRKCLEDCVVRSEAARAWGLLLEFSIPRKEMRIDAVLLIGDAIVLPSHHDDLAVIGRVSEHIVCSLLGP